MICDNCEKANKTCPVYPSDSSDCVEFVHKFAWVEGVLTRIDMIGQNGNCGEHCGKGEKYCSEQCRAEGVE